MVTFRHGIRRRAGRRSPAVGVDVAGGENRAEDAAPEVPSGVRNAVHALHLLTTGLVVLYVLSTILREPPVHDHLLRRVGREPGLPRVRGARRPPGRPCQ